MTEQTVAGRHTRQPIVVGVDGSPRSLEALRWAADQADRTGAGLLALISWHVRLPGVELAAAATDAEAAAREVLLAALTAALGAEHAATVETRVSGSRPAEALLQLSGDAELVVVGGDAHTAVPDFPLGAVPEQLITYADCPVAVIRATAAAREHRIVVGLDGSPGSRDALAWALQQARRSGATVDAVVVWDWRPRYAVYPYGPPEEHYHRAAEELLRAELDRLEPRDRTLVTGRTVRGHPARVLSEAARDAALLVVGSRGTGGGFRHLIGSVSSQCVRHAAVPVVVTHQRRSASKA
jgi:nucleotide-binding universal stress UspA family protein